MDADSRHVVTSGCITRASSLVKLEVAFLGIMTVLEGNRVASRVRVFIMVAVAGTRVAVVKVVLVDSSVLALKRMFGLGDKVSDVEQGMHCFL